MKGEKGLTLFGTVILIVIIALMVFAVVYFARMQVDKEKTENLKTDMLLVKAKVQTISGKYILEKKDEILIGTKLSDMKEESGIRQFLEKKLFDADEKNKKYYVLNQENLNELSLDNVILEDGTYYIVEYTLGEVYYTGGYTDEEGKEHYQVKEVEDEIKKEKEQNQEQNEENSVE